MIKVANEAAKTSPVFGLVDHSSLQEKSLTFATEILSSALIIILNKNHEMAGTAGPAGPDTRAAFFSIPIPYSLSYWRFHQNDVFFILFNVI